MYRIFLDIFRNIKRLQNKFKVPLLEWLHCIRRSLCCLMSCVEASRQLRRRRNREKRAEQWQCAASVQSITIWQQCTHARTHTRTQNHYCSLKTSLVAGFLLFHHFTWMQETAEEESNVTVINLCYRNKCTDAQVVSHHTHALFHVDTHTHIYLHIHTS